MSERQQVFPWDAKIDAILPDGTHQYWSTHCRHDNHEACSATEITGERSAGNRGVTSIARQPAQCKTCANPCICPCHAGSVSLERS